MNSISILEFDKIKEKLMQHAISEPGKKMCEDLEPYPDFDTASRSLDETESAVIFLARFGAPNFEGINDITQSCKRASTGSVLSIKEIINVGLILRCARGVEEFFENRTENTPFADIVSELYINKYLEDRISTSFLSEEEVADTASSTLRDIRRKKANARARIRSILDGLIHSPAHQKHLQDTIITIRNDRFVLPVKSEYKNEINGLVHDVSSSGATLFIEPVQVVAANNELSILAADEAKEIERILSDFSAEIGNLCNLIIRNFEISAFFDFTFAKARFSNEIKAVKPIIKKEGYIKLVNARHPLIDKNKVVPISFELGKDFNALIITGPNTGGKTVTLKTTGLISLMAKAGLFIPANDGAVVPFFDSIFADIGDEQSIEQNLSTFSSHMRNIVSILDSVTESSLVLLDELGSGTDPAEGAALAIAIIETIGKKGAKLMCTTHYAELKTYAIQTAGVENACCEFDVSTLMPTYRLLIGLPGKSNAFAIASKLGISNSIIDAATEKLNHETIKVDNILADLESKRKSIEIDSERAYELRKEEEKKLRDTEELLRKKQEEAEKEIAKQKAKAADLLEKTKRDIDYMLRQIDELRKEKERSDFKARISQTKNEILQMTDKLEKETQTESKRVKKPLPRPLKVGDNIIIFSINKPGIVIEAPDKKGNVLVSSGSIKTRINISDLELNEDIKKEHDTTHILKLERGSRSAKNEIDIRGMTGDEADGLIDELLNNAAMANLNTVSIIHGKGTGALRAAVHEKLRKHPLVAEFRLGLYGEGETGVTIVTLKQ
jgi:DNA mismatch repair protein MutS2